MSILKIDRRPFLTAVQIPLRLGNMQWRFLIDKQPPIRHTLPTTKQLLIPHPFQITVIFVKFAEN
jgi:hypothetical protein